jgi:hypothetical protein
MSQGPCLLGDHFLTHLDNLDLVRLGLPPLDQLSPALGTTDQTASRLLGISSIGREGVLESLRIQGTSRSPKTATGTAIPRILSHTRRKRPRPLEGLFALAIEHLFGLVSGRGIPAHFSLRFLGHPNPNRRVTRDSLDGIIGNELRGLVLSIDNTSTPVVVDHIAAISPSDLNCLEGSGNHQALLLPLENSKAKKAKRCDDQE